MNCCDDRRAKCTSKHTAAIVCNSPDSFPSCFVEFDKATASLHKDCITMQQWRRRKSKGWHRRIKTFLEITHGVRRLGSAATDLAYVACGRMGGFFEYNLNPWDVAAGSLIVERAGGKVTDFKGGDNFLYGGEICAAGAIQADMVEVIKRHWGY